MAFNVNENQVSDLARPFVNTVNIREFYADPKNETAYRKWHIEKYGCEPKDDVFYGK